MSAGPQGEIRRERVGDGSLRRFRAAYARHRASEGRGPLDRATLLALPYPESGPFRREWAVRARSFERLVADVVEPLAASLGRPLRVADLGAGNGWLSYRLERGGHACVAVDLRTDRVDGLGAAAGYREVLDGMFGRVAGSFESLPLGRDAFDVAVFNASFHYALDLEAVLAEAARVVRAGGRLVILDSPFYRGDRAGEAMAEEKRRNAPRVFGDLWRDLTALPFVEYLTRERLARHSDPAGLEWRRLRVRYPLWYELRPLVALLRRRRPPSRFDVWVAEVP